MDNSIDKHTTCLYNNALTLDVLFHGYFCRVEGLLTRRNDGTRGVLSWRSPLLCRNSIEKVVDALRIKYTEGVHFRGGYIFTCARAFNVFDPFLGKRVAVRGLTHGAADWSECGRK